MPARGVAGGGLWGSSGVPGGKEESRVVGILMVEPEASRYVRRSEVVEVRSSCAEGATEEKDSGGKQKCKICQQQIPFA